MASKESQVGWVKRSTRPSRRPVYYGEASAYPTPQNAGDGDFDMISDYSTEDCSGADGSETGVESDDDYEEKSLSRKAHQPAAESGDEYVKKAHAKRPGARPAARARSPGGRSRKPSIEQESDSDYDMDSPEEECLTDDEDGDDESDTDDESDFGIEKSTPTRDIARFTSSISLKKPIIRTPPKSPSPRPRASTPAWIPLCQNPNRYEPPSSSKKQGRIAPYMPLPWNSSLSPPALSYDGDSEYSSSEDNDNDDDDDDDDDEAAEEFQKPLAPFYSIMDPRNPKSPANFVSCMAHLPPDDESDWEPSRPVEQLLKRKVEVDENSDWEAIRPVKLLKRTFTDEESEPESDYSEYMDDDGDSDDEMEDL